MNKSFSKKLVLKPFSQTFQWWRELGVLGTTLSFIVTVPHDDMHGQEENVFLRYLWPRKGVYICMPHLSGVDTSQTGLP